MLEYKICHAAGSCVAQKSFVPGHDPSCCSLLGHLFGSICCRNLKYFKGVGCVVSICTSSVRKVFLLSQLRRSFGFGTLRVHLGSCHLPSTNGVIRALKANKHVKIPGEETNSCRKMRMFVMMKFKVSLWRERGCVHFL